MRLVYITLARKILCYGSFPAKVLLGTNAYNSLDKKAPAFHVWDKRNTVSDIHGKGQLAPLHSKLAFMPLPFPGFGIPGEAHANTIF